MKKILMFGIVAFLSAVSVACSGEDLTSEEPGVPVTGIAFSKPIVSVELGKTRKLNATIAPNDASNRGVVWSSSNVQVATVSKGVVTGVKEGEATITIKAVDGGKTATCTVKVASKLMSYAIGDLHPNDEHPVGVVFWLEPVTVTDGKGFEGKVVSLDESNLIWGRAGIVVNTINVEDGAANMAIIESLEGWESKYPAFKWCADKGKGWYLPALGELLSLYRNKEIVNTAIRRVANSITVSDALYWASTEHYETPENLAGCLFFRDAAIDGWASKNGRNRVRAVFAF